MTQEQGGKKPKAAAAEARRAPSADAGTKNAAKPRLNALQLATILRPFWVEVLSNNIKNTKKILTEFGHKLDFNAARYTPNADGTGLHLCAQYGFVAMAQLLLDFGLDMNAPNKVGSTPLHVACKFQQTAMVTFLLDKGAYVDLPDHVSALSCDFLLYCSQATNRAIVQQYRVAFDVAPYAVLDLCVLKPLRDRQLQLEECQSLFNSENQEAQEQLEAAALRFVQQSMVVSDFESRTWDERIKVSATRVIENECELRVQDARRELDQKQALCAAHQQLLVDLDDERAAAALGIRKQAEREQRDAIERLQGAQMVLQHTSNELNHAQDTLDMECGLVDAATEYPNDPEVQSWVLSTVSLMLQDRNTSDPEAESELQRILMRTEITQVVMNVFGRYESSRHLQVQALHCLVQLLRFCRSAGSSCDLRTRVFAMELIQSNMITAVGDIVLRFENDITITAIALEALYRLFRVPKSTRQVIQFCQSKANQMLPVKVLALDSTSSRTHRHAAFVLFTMTKYNVRQGLLRHGIVKLIMPLLGSIMRKNAEMIQYLVASLALLHPVPTQGPVKGKLYDSSLDAEPAWALFHVKAFAETVQSLVQPAANDTAEPSGQVFDALIYWTISLLRNLVWHRGFQSQRIRAELRSIENLNWIGTATVTIRTAVISRQTDHDMLGNMIQIALELIQATFVEYYDDDGRQMKTLPEVLDILIKLLMLEVTSLSNSIDSTGANGLAGLLALLAKVISNSTCFHQLISCALEIDRR